jgi:hypothetical protein
MKKQFYIFSCNMRHSEESGSNLVWECWIQIHFKIEYGSATLA